MRPVTLLGALTFFSLAGVLASACSSSDPVSTTTTTGTGGSGTTSATNTGGGSVSDVCIAHNCNSDAECAGCPNAHTTCLLSDHRCVACGNGTSTTCPSGYECSSYGECVPVGKTCPTNAGVPTISCASSADCVACDPMHQVCDTATKQCVACTQNDTSNCQKTDLCLAGKCAPKCPKECREDNDCSQCGTAAAPAHACNAHKCAQCSETYSCKAGEVCTPNGTCQKRCGLEGPVEGTCETDDDCVGCGGGSTKCHVPLNGGHGTCGPEAAGCSDLGNGTITLPSPFNKVTNTCSNDGDCNGIGITYNVGKLLRDLTGYDEIHDANLNYPMSTCASVTIASKSCGICVPCAVDSDCMDIDIDQVATDAFGPLGSIGAALLLDNIFGNNDHKIHMYCQGVAAGYGVCAPCPGILTDCSTGGGGATGSCGHDACTAGTKLGSNCGTCEADVCAIDAYCCDTNWDDQCVSEADQYCNGICSGNACGHDECTAGDSLAESCTACTADVCAADPFCCQTAWDSTCVGEAGSVCGKSCQ